MSLQTATPSVPTFAGHVVHPACPRCGLELFVPDQSAFVDENRVQHRWSCDVCDDAFETVVEIGR